MIDFPASPTPGQRFTAAGATWIFDGVKWLPEGLAPTVAPGINDNRIINGDMRIDQRNNGVSGTAYGYTVDRWQINGSAPSKFTWGRNSTGLFSDFPYSIGAQSTSAYALTASDWFLLQQVIEADMVSDFAWGTASAKPVTLSFWALSSLGGTFGGSIVNGAANRSYPFTFPLVAGTPTKIIITIPGDTGGAWTLSGNGKGVTINFDLGGGATYRGPANAWANAWYIGATGSVSLVATNAAQFYLTGVKLEIGSIATPFNRQSLAKSMADCQRYYQTGQLNFSLPAPVTASANLIFSSLCPVQMRASATMTRTGGSDTNLATPTLAHNNLSFNAVATTVTTAQPTLNVVFSASAEL